MQTVSDFAGVLQVAIPSPLPQIFDYLLPANSVMAQIVPGMRVRVPFGRSQKIGVIVALANDSQFERARLKPVFELLDDTALVSAEIQSLAQWASRYYHYPLGEVLAATLPTLLRKGEAAHVSGEKVWALNAAGMAVEPNSLMRAPRQLGLLQLLQKADKPLNASALELQFENWRGIMRSLVDKGWIETQEQTTLLVPTTETDTPPPLNDAQQSACDAIGSALGGFQSLLLDGVTGSGKTEVYFSAVEKVLQKGQQALILVPEIGLTPQLLRRFQARFSVPIALLHSGLNDKARKNSWLQAKAGDAPIVIGTRSAVFTPMRNLGIILIDEEHDLSFKQQDGFRYHARDVAIRRAQQAGIPIVLGSATPSLESLHNARQGRFQHLTLPERAGNAIPPTIRLLDVCQQKLTEGFSSMMLQAIQHHLDKGQQVLLFLNRRGYAPTLICHDCGWLANCQRCDAHMILHKSRHLLRCHHCDSQRRIDSQCPDCGSVDLRPLGQGTERAAEALSERFPNNEIIRIDRDSTRRKGALQALLKQVEDGRGQILLGTQMLAKGHHLPNVTLVGILDADQGLFGLDFRSSERMGQLIIQVAGRAGRGDSRGEVLIQTHHPEHPLLNGIITHDYGRFASDLLLERSQAMLPPFRHIALLRAEASSREMPNEFLSAARDMGFQLANPAELLGPIPAGMEKRAGRYRAQLLIQADDRARLHNFLRQWLPQLGQLPLAKKVRWSIDVDAMELS
ncbi:MAG: primosomal protein N' [Thiotrichaceae bacterium]|nr:primosomal protein N' [Thiotrichaceae bacterium]